MHLPFSRGPVITVLLVTLSAALLAASTGQTTSSGSGSPTPQHAPSELRLYRGLFSIVAHMERDRLARLANPQGQVGDVAAVEESLRSEIDLSKADWQTFVTTAVKVETYIEEAGKQARAYAHQGRADMAQSLDKAQTLSSLKMGLHKMQVQQDARLSQDIQELETNVGADSTAKIHAYLEGPLAASAHVTPLKPHSKGTR